MFRQHCLNQNQKSWHAFAAYTEDPKNEKSQSWPSIKADENVSNNHTWQEAFEVLGLSWNSDGTLNREILIPMVNATPSVTDPDNPPVALSNDVLLSDMSKAYVRIYIPVNPPTDTKLPLIIYLHGGDFVIYSASTVIFHNFCNDIASQFPAVVVSVEYRLAPENRLPVAYDDAINAIFWIKNQALDDPYVPLYICDVLWSLALPLYANRDHEFCNPISGGSFLGRVPRLPRVFVKADEGDPFVDRTTQLVNLLKGYKVSVVYQHNQGGFHGIELQNTTAAQILYNDMKLFIDSTTTRVTHNEEYHAAY
ncbi:unnamed protein product [Fraxinus pennsylvanica]|uniref:Alpha/beta hydrolase fold-3 domain-containing protein n=1 Tax=Fraxinus pennsylvanica TaxID=56036 RepID=A0AAD2DSL8_9LAMI|nr:unnamed protein product [Fraxinus pennsylvanica]